MFRLRTIWLVLLMFGISFSARAQDNPQTANPQTQGTAAPAPAFGQANTPILNPENPPLSGLDEPSLELKGAARSFISEALQIGESGDSNPSNQLAGSNSEAISSVLGALDLQKFWPRSDLFLEYLGGGVFGDNPYYARQLQAVGLEGVTRWRTGELTLRDAFSYLPDGSFYAGTAGGLPGFGLTTTGVGLGMPGIFHLATEGAVGTIPRLTNTGILDAVQAISPRSAFTVAGAYSNSHFYHNESNLVNGDGTTIEGGYSHLISRHDQIAVAYAFQLFRFPDNAGGEIYNHVLNVRWSHTISGRLSFVGSVGPQYTELLYGIHYSQWSPAGRAALRYRFEHAQLALVYEKFLSQGSGFFAGADTQAALATIKRPLGRTYELTADAKYSNNKRLQPAVVAGVTANSYNEGSAGLLLRKHLGRTFDVLAAYRFSEVEFDIPIKLGGDTGKTNQRQVGTIALEWHPKPTRIE